MYKTKDVAVVILNWNGVALLEQFMPSVIKCSSDATIYVIDNASTDNSIPFLKTHYPHIKLIELQINGGYAKGYNDGLQAITEPILCLLNNDVEVTDNWLTPVIEVFSGDSTTVIIQPKLLDYKDKTSFEYAGAAGGFIDKYGYPYCRGRIFNTIEKDKGQYDDQKNILWASGACFFIKNETFKSLGGFDETYFAHMEEIDLCWRAYNQNLTVKYVGTSTVYHLGGGTLSNTSPKKTYLNFRNSLYTLIKNTDSHVLGRTLIRMLLDGVAALRFLIKLQPKHFLAILKAHGSLYINLSRLLKLRKELPKRPNYYSVNSIVWLYFIKRKTHF
ncbi:glycosyltransferase family 2 protein [Winogradskyella aurantia]|uniref:dTDP-Rha--alpha-D-GlcNAc-pyrophosphate polyprenol alpha-3-L-rhamnosyltransferase n=1 Tax=Winogradskyella aurantia TaxID=1915063 RepID=A0A265UXF4_9FLAO|nr:glycosyltransferase family 2 protein [Winogradskyella aurantia]OZV69995.1 dTDP-Rha--alpha-D-GlcNAc-pyrophosphate polyprenol alpha-3-L-rhamnosyltransferase [Winogradskyella aurantia]